jgi:DNA invertase Pin-like site-specific DNA recombinase
MAAQQTLTAREYRRLSDDKPSNSIERQGNSNKRAADEQGFNLGEPYVDENRSASASATRKREDFDRLISEVRTGKFGAQVLMLWEVSRGSRKVREWLDLIDVCKAADVKIWVTKDKRLFDPSNGRDEDDLIADALRSSGESRGISERGRDEALRQAEEGLPHGKPGFGYRAVRDEKGQLLTWVADEKEAPIVRELFKLLATGHSQRSVAQRFAEKGYTNKSGKPFTRQQLRTVALRCAYAGIRMHKGREYKGTWDALVSEERFRTVEQMLTNPANKTHRDGKAKHEFTHVIVCEKCGSGVAVRTPKGVASYHCINGHASMRKAKADAIIVPKLIEYLSDEDVYAALTARSDDDPELDQVRAELIKARADKKEVSAAVPESIEEARAFARLEKGLDERIVELETRERQMTLPPALAELLGAGKSIEKAWWDAPVSACREIARTVMTPERMGQPVLTYVGNTGGHPYPHKERLQWRTVKKEQSRGKKE